MLAALIAAAIPFGSAQEDPMASHFQAQREAAMQMNELAGHIHSPEDARRFVDMVAKAFADELPPKWATASIRDRIAEAEYQSATNPARLITEQSVADAWNKYAGEIGATDEARVTVAEIHNLRDGEFATARVLWNRGSQNIWTMPDVFAVGPDGKVANGCRAVETLRVVWDISNQFENLRAARERVQKGMVVSDWLGKEQASQSSVHARTEVRVSVRPENPVESAERRYVQEHGAAEFSRVVEEMVGNLLN